MVELLVTMSILTGLVMMASAVYSGYVRDANLQVLKENLFALRSATQHFYSDHARYPLHGADVFGNRVSFLDNASSELVQGPHKMRDRGQANNFGYPLNRVRYLPEIPIDPTTNLANWKILTQRASLTRTNVDGTDSVVDTLVVTNVASSNPEFANL